MRRDWEAQSAVAALAHCIAASDACNWQLHKLTQGGQARVFAARRSRPMEASPPAAERATGDLAALPETLVIKLFAPALDAAQVIQQQCEAMAELRGAAHGMQAGGWTVTVPRVLYCDSANRAMVMEYASGRPVRQLMQMPYPQPAVWQPWADIALGGLMRYWQEVGRIYGDLNLRNVLCDPTRKTIALIDAGAPAAHWHFPQPPCHWFPASRDLAYLLYFVATEIKANLLQPGLRRQQLRFVTYLLRRFIEQAVAPEQQQAFVQELRHCAAMHLAALHTGWTPRGIWTRQVRQTAAETIDRVLRQLSGHGRRGQPWPRETAGQEAATL